MGAPGSWETAMRKELLKRRRRAERKKRLKTLLFRCLFLPLWLGIRLIDYAKNLHKFQL